MSSETGSAPGPAGASAGEARRREHEASDDAAAAFGELARGLTAGGERFEQRLLALAQELCQAGSAGLTTFEPAEGSQRLYSLVHGSLAHCSGAARCASPLPAWLEAGGGPQLVREPAKALPLLRRAPRSGWPATTAGGGSRRGKRGC